MNASWRARHGFGCALALVLSSLALNQALRAAFESNAGFADWVISHSLLVEDLRFFFRACLWLVIVYLFSRAPAISSFLDQAGLKQRPTFSGWIMAWTAVALGSVLLILITKGILQPNEVAAQQHVFGGARWRFFIVQTVVLAPFYEEVVMRGFLYRAFRGSFQSLPSALLVVALDSVYFHWGLASRDLITFLALIFGGLVLCAIRERTVSTWNCVLFHAVYNATVMRQWLICLIVLGLVLAFCSRYSQPRTNCDTSPR